MGRVVYLCDAHELEAMPLGQRYSKNTLGISLQNSPRAAMFPNAFFMAHNSVWVSARVSEACARKSTRNSNRVCSHLCAFLPAGAPQPSGIWSV